MRVAIGTEKSEWDGEISKQVSLAEFAIGLPHGTCDVMYILLVIWSKCDSRYCALFLISN